MKKKITLVIPFIVVTSSWLHGMKQQLNTSTTNALEIIYGNLIIHPHETIMYAPFVQKGVAPVLNIIMQPSDPLVPIRALKPGSTTKTLYFGKEFPEYLPLSLLMNKKEDDSLAFFTEKDQRIVLACKQKAYNPKATFEQQLGCLLCIFKKKPSYHLFDERDLVAQGIIIPSKGGYLHGPKSFKFDE